MTTSNPRIDVKDAARGGWFGARQEAHLPARANGAGPAVPAAESHSGESRAQLWMRRARRALMDLALVLAAMTAIPVVLVWLSPPLSMHSQFERDYSHSKSQTAEASRPFALPADPSISPLEAGRAFVALQLAHPAFAAQPAKNSLEYVTRFGPEPRLFPSVRPTIRAMPDYNAMLDAAVAGFSPAEMAYLSAVATRPSWSGFDRVARAPAIDVLASRAGPLSPLSDQFPTYGGTRELAFDAVSRAAYHLALGQRDSAETILRSIISFGFAIEDNGTEYSDAGLGRLVVEQGRSALERFYIVTRDPRAAAVGAARQTARPRGSPAPAIGVSESPVWAGAAMRRELIRRASDPEAARGIRFAALEALRGSTCGNVSELLFGPRADVRDAFEQAKLNLARYPSERALLDWIQRGPDATALYDRSSSSLQRFLIGTSSIAGTVLGNQRLATCTWEVGEGRSHF